MFPISVCFPSKELSNEDLHRIFSDFNAEKVAKKIGVTSRHVAAAGETALDLAAGAAENLFAANPELRAQTDYLLFCTQSPDYFLPTGACILQDRLGLSRQIGALDFNLGCSGFVYGLSLAKGLLGSGIASGVLLLTAETYTRYLHPEDRGNRAIFGDGAAAVFLNPEDAARIGGFFLGTDGRGRDNLIVRNGGARHAWDPDAAGKEAGMNSTYSDNHLYMNGPEIFNFTIEAVPAMVRRVLEKNRLTMDEINYVIFHQANSFMLSYLRTLIGIPSDRFYMNLEHTGNTVSSTLPIALADAERRKLISAGDKVLIAGFGVGYSYGATVLTI